MLRAYFDESGIHAGSQFCVLSGFVLSSKRSGYLLTDWHNLLFSHGIPYFHAKEFSGRSGPFRAWSKQQCDDFAIDAVSTINQAFGYEGVLVAAALQSRSFYSLSTDERRWLTGGQYIASAKDGAKKWRKQGAPTKPYFLLFQQVILDAVKFSQERNFAGAFTGKGDAVRFVFDKQDEYESTARQFIKP